MYATGRGGSDVYSAVGPDWAHQGNSGEATVPVHIVCKVTFSIFPVKKAIFGLVIFSTRLAHACPRGRVALSSSTRNFWSDGLRRSVRDAPELRPPVCLTALALDTWHAPPRGCPSPPNARAGAPSAARRLGRPRMVCRPGVPLVGSPLGRKVGYPVITSTSGRGGTYLTARG